MNPTSGLSLARRLCFEEPPLSIAICVRLEICQEPKILRGREEESHQPFVPHCYDWIAKDTNITKEKTDVLLVSFPRRECL